MADQVDPNLFTTPYQLTKTLHRDVYPAVDSTSPSLKVTGKVVLVTGAGGGLGYAIAKAWSDANAKGIVLVGRDTKTLESTAADLEVPYLVVPGDITKEADVESIFGKAVEKFETIDTVINASGTLTLGPIAALEPSTWWAAYEINIKGPYNLAHYFIKASGGKGTFINLVSIGAFGLAPGMSSYSPSTLARVKFGQHLALEQPDLRVFSVHPGVVEVSKGRGAIVDFFTPFAKDKQALTGGFTLYLQKPEADYLRGGFSSVNWDIEEMEQHKEEITEGNLLQLRGESTSLNAKLGPEGHPWSKK
ncbi:NAD(P)-binding protein [Lophiostoma macrostomum CBS 122681]|uniref:NAD(P)-binding protein n=1 Tax=Lophiostoma macrostomum CBS 122681 TaxID=1314788 RepID=A0A6A6TT07_9PLEO|nr:NAD(P)-binding protein [Lophiostoma macrostomum CBS 122681]